MANNSCVTKKEIEKNMPQLLAIFKNTLVNAAAQVLLLT